MAESPLSEYGAGYSSTAPTERYVWTRNRRFRGGAKYGVIGIGGFGATAPAYAAGAGEQANLRNGIPELNADLVDGKQWGNDTVSAAGGRIDELFAFGVSHCGFKSGKFILSAGSHGTTCALNYAKANPSKVAAIALSLPAVSPQDIHDNARASAFGATPAQMESVYGGSSSAFNTAMATHNPASYPASYNGIPILMFASSDDPVCLFSLAQAFAAGCSSATLVNQGAIGHNGSSDPALIAQARAFVTAYA